MAVSRGHRVWKVARSHVEYARSESTQIKENIAMDVAQNKQKEEEQKKKKKKKSDHSLITQNCCSHLHEACISQLVNTVQR